MKLNLNLKRSDEVNRDCQGRQQRECPVNWSTRTNKPELLLLVLSTRISLRKRCRCQSEYLLYNATMLQCTGRTENRGEEANGRMVNGQLWMCVYHILQ